MEKTLDELLIVYTQDQPAYVEMARYVPTVKLVRLDKTPSFDMDVFTELLGSAQDRTRGIVFDDVGLLLEQFIRAKPQFKFGLG